MKKIGLLLTAILLSPLAMAQTAPATPKAQAPQTWYVAPIVIDETSEAQKALTKEFTAQMIKTIKILKKSQDHLTRHLKDFLDTRFI